MAFFMGSVCMRAAFYARKASCPLSVSTERGTKKPIGDDLGLGNGFAPRVSCVLLVICLLAGSASVWLFETSPAIAKQKSTVVKKDKKSSVVKTDKSVAANKKKQKSFVAKHRKSIVSAKEGAHIVPEVRTPVDKHEKDVVAAPEKAKTGPAIQVLRVKPDEDLSDVRANWLDDAPVDLMAGEDLSGMFGVGGQWIVPAYDATAGERASLGTRFVPPR